MLSIVGSWAERTLLQRNPWTNVHGLARTTLALATAVTLLANPASVLFHPAAGVDAAPFCHGVQGASAFCVAPTGSLDGVRFVLAALLVVIASGIRPRWTGLLHWWITWSLHVSAVVVDGGDQVAAILTLLLIPVTLMDPRASHWDQPEPWRRTKGETLGALVAHVALFLVRLQVAGIYFHAAVGKFGTPEWADGTALYYWLSNPTFGAPRWLQPLVSAITTNGTLVSLLTWSVVVLELVLFLGLVVGPKFRKMLLAGGIALHAAILVLHGLVSFAPTMMAALLLFLWPVEERLVFFSSFARISNHPRRNETHELAIIGL